LDSAIAPSQTSHDGVVNTATRHIAEDLAALRLEALKRLLFDGGEADVHDLVKVGDIVALRHAGHACHDAVAVPHAV
jgi:hypothetical protein